MNSPASVPCHLDRITLCLLALLLAAICCGGCATGEANQLVGTWIERAQLACEDGTASAAPQAIGELVFERDGGFSVTWFPFETYKDYWGEYSLNESDGTLQLKVAGGNYIPSDLDLSGAYHIDETGALRLEDLWLGSSPQQAGPVRCGYVFERIADS
jgi:hypothetical protein